MNSGSPLNYFTPLAEELVSHFNSHPSPSDPTTRNHMQLLKVSS